MEAEVVFELDILELAVLELAVLEEVVEVGRPRHVGRVVVQVLVPLQKLF